MKLLPLNELGTHELPGNRVRFGFLLPWVSAVNVNALYVKVIHEEDQFLQKIMPKRFPLIHSMHPQYEDFWQREIDINVADRSSPISA